MTPGPWGPGALHTDLARFERSRGSGTHRRGSGSWADLSSKNWSSSASVRALKHDAGNGSDGLGTVLGLLLSEHRLSAAGEDSDPFNGVGGSPVGVH